MLKFTLLLLPFSLLLPSCNDSKSNSVAILTTFNGISTFHKEIDGVTPGQIGAKHYSIEPVADYTEFLVILTENGKETVLATQKIDHSAENNAASLHIQHSHNRWDWFFRYSKRSGYHGIFEDQIQKGWHISHATMSRYAGLKKPTETLDTFYLLKDGNPFEKLPLGAQNFPSGTSEEIINFTKGKTYLKAISLILKK